MNRFKHFKLLGVALLVMIVGLAAPSVTRGYDAFSNREATELDNNAGFGAKIHDLRFFHRVRQIITEWEANTLPSIASTDATSWTINAAGATNRLNFTAGGTGDYLYTITVPTMGAAYSNTLPTGTGKYFALTTDPTGAVTAGTDIDAGSTSVAGTLDVFAGSGNANDKLIFDPVTTGGNYGITITNEAMAAARIFKLPEAGASPVQFVTTDADQTCTVTTGAADRTITLGGNVSFGGAVTLAGALTTAGAVEFTGAFDAIVTVPDSSTWNLPAGGGDLAVLTGAETGTTADTFEINNDGNSITISSSGMTADYVFTAPDGTDDEFVTLTGTQSLTNKTAAGLSLSGTLALTTVSVTGAWTDLGTVDTADIDGGTADAVVIGGTTPAAGDFTTLDSTLASTFAGGYGSSGVTVSVAGAIQANGALTIDGSSALNGGITVDTTNFTVSGTTGAVVTASSAQANSIVCTLGATFGGGYGSTGATLSAAGVLQINGAFTTDSTITCAAGGVARAALAEDSLAKIGIPFTALRNSAGLPLVAAAEDNEFGLTFAGFGTGTHTIDGDPTAGETETQTLCFHVALPADYISDADVKITVAAKESVGEATTSTTISGEVYEDDGDGTVSANILASWDATDVTTSWTTFTATITDTALVAGDKLMVFIRVVCVDGAATGTVVQIGKIEVQYDRK